MAVGLALATAVVAPVALPAAPASADGGLAVTGRSRYVVDLAKKVVTAQITADLTNHSPNQVVAGGERSFYYYDYGFVLPDGAQNVTATSRGDSLPVAINPIPGPTPGSVARVSFANLLYGQSRSITVSFTLPGSAPRSANPTRVGPGYATFEVWSPGDPGRSQVEIVLPKGMEPTATTNDVVQTGTSGNSVTYRVTPSSDGHGWAAVSARDQAQVSTSTVTVGATKLAIDAFPGDTAWTSYVRTGVTRGLPVLERLVGQKWPDQIKTIREDSAVYVRGYGGWYDPLAREIVIGEEFDEGTIYHELSHAWMSRRSITDRWMYEGLAEFLSDKTATATGVKRSPALTLKPTDKGAIRLSDWGNTTDQASTTADAYAYPASRAVLTMLLGSVPDARLTPILHGIAVGESAYDKPGTISDLSDTTTWQRFLDLVQVRGGVTTAPAVLSTWVLTPAERALLPARSTALSRYAALDKADGPWRPPAVLRRAMTKWDFSTATSMHPALTTLATAAAAAQQTAARTGLPVPAAEQQAYEELLYESQFATATTHLGELSTTMTTVAQARTMTSAAAAGNPLARVGVLVQRTSADAKDATRALAADDLDAAKAAARTATTEADRASLVGAGSLGTLVLLLVGGALAARRLRRRQRVRNMRVLPKVLGLTRSKSRNSATPSS